MEQTECSETWAYKIQTPGNYPEESMQHSFLIVWYLLLSCVIIVAIFAAQIGIVVFL
jgi:hypothetical protein